ncbi:hypothetical protein Prudu_004138 [Prunus dulcis]|uniref:Uncharacterized protein n=1 Tax=Prunus dulcis TaxID=3755 RepID=A0A4Y1QUM1_PRUDU|nr:hypothetical protein Prudu_004138 [Prunus dulcis]
MVIIFGRGIWVRCGRKRSERQCLLDYGGEEAMGGEAEACEQVTLLIIGIGKLYPKSRETGTATYESTSTTTATKRARRKKTFAELKEEESSLLKEKTFLEKEIATLQATCKQQRAKNENFKRIKLDLNMHPARNLSANFDGAGKAISSQPHERTASSTYGIPSNLPPHPEAQSDSYSEREAVSARDNSFLLPDLNMEPCGEESGSETLYGMS